MTITYITTFFNNVKLMGVKNVGNKSTFLINMYETLKINTKFMMPHQVLPSNPREA